ncbi:uncharacterized protein LOC135121626 isoform X2 [Zophobas morio]|uniref:uncharacterized protein LOC135121626 isoform X2 n=1 Tax=Zophobas morio TaxID=2755281 RepID=UPI0030831C60
MSNNTEKNSHNNSPHFRFINQPNQSYNYYDYQEGSSAHYQPGYLEPSIYPKEPYLSTAPEVRISHLNELPSLHPDSHYSTNSSETYSPGFATSNTAPQFSSFQQSSESQKSAFSQMPEPLYSQASTFQTFPPLQHSNYLDKQSYFPMSALGSTMFTNFVPGMASIRFQERAHEVGAWIDSVKYYFQVNTTYVSYKIILLLFPYRHKDWKRKEVIGTSSGIPSFITPNEDINAPDLYLPVISFVTYVLLCGAYFGKNNTFTPEKLGLVASSALLWLLLEVGILYLSFYFLTVRGNYSCLDFFSYSGYKYVSLCFVALSLLFRGDLKVLFYFSWLATSIPCAYFLCTR